MKKIILLMMVTILVSCGGEPRSVEREVDAIYWHEGQRYTAKVEVADMIVDYSIPAWGLGRADSVTLYKDVAAGDKSWYKCEWMWNEFTGTDADAYCEIHIHSLDDLGTADWNHGKFGSGSTTRID